MQNEVAPGPPHQRPPQKKSGGKGCLIALSIVAGIVVLTAIVAGIFIYKLATSKEGSALISMVGEGTDIAKEAMNAPGTKELKALGCQTAMVMDMERMLKLVTRLNDGGGVDPSKVAGRVIVTCQVGFFGQAPSCDDVARTYVGAVGKLAVGFIAQVSSQRGQQSGCMKLYDAGGTFVSDYTGGHASVPKSE